MGIAEAANQRVQQEIAALRRELDELRDAASNQQQSADATALTLVRQQTRSQTLNAAICESEQRIAVMRGKLAEKMKERDEQRGSGQQQTDDRIRSLQQTAESVNNDVSKLLRLQLDDDDADADQDCGHDVSDERHNPLQ